MSGHSRWSQIKRKKGKADVQRGKLFSKILREITVATPADVVIAEVVLLMGTGAVLGMAIAAGALPFVNGATGGRFPPLFVGPTTWALALGAALGLALAVALPPALRVKRLKIVDALAGHA